MNTTEVHIAVNTRTPAKAPPAIWLMAGLALLFSLLVSYGFILLNNAIADPMRALLATAGFCTLLLIGVPCAYLLRAGRTPETLRSASMLALAVLGVVLTAVYVFWVHSYVLFPADILIWSESDFFNDIIKFRTGYPLYSNQANNESFTYPPGSQLFTYALAWALGHGTSVPVLRLIQVIYTILAALLALLCCRRIAEIAGVSHFLDTRIGTSFGFLVLFLTATNSITNRFTHNLHNDSLAQLINIAAFVLLVEYIRCKSRRLLVLMALVPAVGFVIKQNLAVWAGLYFLYFAFFEKPRSLKRLSQFAAGSAAALSAVMIGCYAVWGGDFVYWTFTVLGSHGVSPLRSFQHLLDVWLYVAIGILGGLALLRSDRAHILTGAWCIWLIIMLLQIYTSGIAWMLNHIGPGCLIAAVWFVAGLGLMLPRNEFHALSGMQHIFAVFVIALLFNGLGFVRVPMPALSQDSLRYVRAIENEFAGHPADRVLLDAGSWVYTKQGVVMKDRAPCIGERGYSETGDFSGILSRIQEKRYSKILVRNLHEDDFWYDHSSWRQSSGIRHALKNNYHETGTIKAADPPLSVRDRAYSPYLFSEITILSPNPM